MEYKLDLSEKTARRKLNYLIEMNNKRNRLIDYLESQRGITLTWNNLLYQIPSLLKQISQITPKNSEEKEIFELMKIAAMYTI